MFSLSQVMFCGLRMLKRLPPSNNSCTDFCTASNRITKSRFQIKSIGFAKIEALAKQCNSVHSLTKPTSSPLPAQPSLYLQTDADALSNCCLTALPSIIVQREAKSKEEQLPRSNWSSLLHQPCRQFYPQH